MRLSVIPASPGISVAMVGSLNSAKSVWLARIESMMALSLGSTEMVSPSMPTLPPAQFGFGLSTSLTFGSHWSSTNGPEPIALVPMLPSATALAGTIEALVPDMATRIGASGWFRWNTTVCGSGVSIEAIEVKFARAAAAVASSSRRSNEAFTSAEVTASPVENLAFGSSLKVSVSPSAENSQLVAMAGDTLYLASRRTSGS